MSAKWSFERRKSFSVPYEELFRNCAMALTANGLKITHMDENLGVIEATKRGFGPFKAEQKVFITVRRDGKVTAITKLDLGLAILESLSPDHLIAEKFFATLQDMSSSQSGLEDTKKLGPD